MRTATGAARKGTTPARATAGANAPAAMLKRITTWLDEAKAEAIVTIDLKGKSTMGDYMVIATCRTDRHVGAVADQVQRNLREEGLGRVRIEGQPQCDWVLIDTGDIIVHLFRSEVREFYNLEKMWSAERTPDPTTH